jgi:hexosaminidase
VYTIDDVKDLIQFARERAISVMPEFDSPGHMSAWAEGYPDLPTKCQHWGAPIDPTRQYSYDIMGSLLDELQDVFPFGLVHTGGDEVSHTCWRENEDVGKWMKENGMEGDYGALETYYNVKLAKMVIERKRRPISWQETFFRTSGQGLPKESIIDVWDCNCDDARWLDSVTKAGFDAVWSAPFYLDKREKYWNHYYDVKLDNLPGTREQQAHVLGVKACMWGETVDTNNLMQRAWPRAAAMAERAWSKLGVHNQESIGAYSRTFEFTCLLHRRGLRPEPLGPGMCEPYLDWDHNNKPIGGFTWLE